MRGSALSRPAASAGAAHAGGFFIEQRGEFVEHGAAQLFDVDQIADDDSDAEFAYGLDVVIRGLEAEAGGKG